VYRSVTINMDCYINRKRYSSINEEVKRLFVRDNISDEGQNRPTEATWWLENWTVNHIPCRLFKIGHDRLLSNSSNWIFIQLKVWIIILLKLTNLHNSISKCYFLLSLQSKATVKLKYTPLLDRGRVGKFGAAFLCIIPYISIDNAHLMYNAHPKLFDIPFDI
jgi:hypothetical protein